MVSLALFLLLSVACQSSVASPTKNRTSSPLFSLREPHGTLIDQFSAGNWLEQFEVEAVSTL